MRGIACIAAVLGIVGAVSAQQTETPDREATIRALIERSRLLEHTTFAVPKEVWKAYIRDTIEGEPLPVGFILAEGRYTVTVGKAPGDAKLNVRLELQVLDPSKSTGLPLLTDGLVWTDIQIDGKPVRPAVSGGWLRFSFPAPGAHTCAAAAVFPRQEGANPRLALPIARTVSTVLRFESPDAWQVEADSGGCCIRGDTTGTRGEIAFSPRGEIAFTCRPPEVLTDRPPKFLLRGVVAWNLDAGMQQLAANLDVAIVGGSTDRLELRLPPDAERVKVSGPDVRETQVSPGAAAVFLRGRITGKTALSVAYDRPRAKSAAAEKLDAPALANGRWTGGSLVVTHTLGGTELLPLAVSGLRETALAEIPPSASSILAGPPSLAYEITASEWSAGVELLSLGEFALTESIADLAHYEVALRPDGTLMGKATWEIRNRYRQFLRLTLPKGARVIFSRVNEEPRHVIDVADARGVCLLPLVRSKASVEGLVSFPVEIVWLARIDTPGPAGGVERIELPRIDIPIGYAWCETWMPEGVGVLKWAGPLKPVERFSSETATASLEVGSSELAEGYRKRIAEIVDRPPVLSMIPSKSLVPDAAPAPRVAPLKPSGEDAYVRARLARNYYRAGNDFYEANDFENARANLRKAIELLPGSTEAANAQRLLGNIQLAAGELELKSKEQKAAGAQVLGGLKQQRVQETQQQEEYVKEGFKALREGQKSVAYQKLAAAEGLSKSIQSKGESERELSARMSKAREALKAVGEDQQAKAEVMNEDVKKLAFEGKYDEAIRKSEEIAKLSPEFESVARGNIMALKVKSAIEKSREAAVAVRKDAGYEFGKTGTATLALADHNKGLMNENTGLAEEYADGHAKFEDLAKKTALPRLNKATPQTALTEAANDFAEYPPEKRQSIDRKYLFAEADDFTNGREIDDAVAATKLARKAEPLQGMGGLMSLGQTYKLAITHLEAGDYAWARQLLLEVKGTVERENLQIQAATRQEIDRRLAVVNGKLARQPAPRSRQQNFVQDVTVETDTGARGYDPDIGTVQEQRSLGQKYRDALELYGQADYAGARRLLAEVKKTVEDEGLQLNSMTKREIDRRLADIDGKLGDRDGDGFADETKRYGGAGYAVSATAKAAAAPNERLRIARGLMGPGGDDRKTATDAPDRKLGTVAKRARDGETLQDSVVRQLAQGTTEYFRSVLRDDTDIPILSKIPIRGTLFSRTDAKAMEDLTPAQPHRLMDDVARAEKVPIQLEEQDIRTKLADGMVFLRERDLKRAEGKFLAAQLQVKYGDFDAAFKKTWLGEIQKYLDLAASTRAQDKATVVVDVSGETADETERPAPREGIDSRIKEAANSPVESELLDKISRSGGRAEPHSVVLDAAEAERVRIQLEEQEITAKLVDGLVFLRERDLKRAEGKFLAAQLQVKYGDFDAAFKKTWLTEIQKDLDLVPATRAVDGGYRYEPPSIRNTPPLEPGRADRMSSLEASKEMKPQNEEQARIIEDENRRRKDEQLKLKVRLAGQFDTFYTRGQYDDALVVLERMKQLDPEDASVREKIKTTMQKKLQVWQYEGKVTRMVQEEKQFAATQEEMTAWYPITRFPNNWKELSDRRPGRVQRPSPQAPATDRNVRQRLDETIVSFVFDEQPAFEAIDFLQTLGKVNIVVDRSKIEETKTVTLKLDNVPLATAVKLMCEQLGLKWVIRDGVVFVSDAEGIRLPAAATFVDNFENRKVRRQLDETVISVTFNEQPVFEAIDFLRTLGKVNIAVDRAALSDEKKTVTLKIDNLRLSTGLKLLTEQLGLVYTIRDGEVFITSAAGEKTPGQNELSPGAPTWVSSGGRLIGSALNGPAPDNDTTGEGEGGGDHLAGKSWGGYIRGLQRTGLDVVFCVDATGSMGGILLEAKTRIRQLVKVISYLVPNARIGVVAYRDQKKYDLDDYEWTVKYLPLVKGNKEGVEKLERFLRELEAYGGGDIPEAVQMGLETAIDKAGWRPGDKKIIIVIGDAPPHAEEDGLEETYELCRKWREENGVVSCIDTTGGSKILPEFAAMAREGGGEAAFLNDERAVLKQIVVLVFGSKWEKEIDGVYKSVLGREEQPAPGGDTLGGGGDGVWLHRVVPEGETSKTDASKDTLEGRNAAPKPVPGRAAPETVTETYDVRDLLGDIPNFQGGNLELQNISSNRSGGAGNTSGTSIFSDEGEVGKRSLDDAMAALTDLVTKQAGGWTMHNGQREYKPVVRGRAGSLIVTHTPDTQQKVQKLLADLRKAKQPQVELGRKINEQRARGIAGFDDFTNGTATIQLRRDGASYFRTPTAEAPQGADRFFGANEEMKRFIESNYSWRWAAKVGVPEKTEGLEYDRTVRGGNWTHLGDANAAVKALDDDADLAEKLRRNLGQKVPVSSVNLNADAARAKALGVSFTNGRNGLNWAVIDEAQFRTLKEVSNSNAAAAVADANPRSQEAIVGADALVANGMLADVTWAGDAGNRLSILDNRVELLHPQYLLIDNGRYLTAVRAGAMQHWTETTQPFFFVAAPQEIDVPRVGPAARFEKTLIEPTDELVIQATIYWKGGVP